MIKFFRHEIEIQHKLRNFTSEKDVQESDAGTGFSSGFRSKKLHQHDLRDEKTLKQKNSIHFWRKKFRLPGEVEPYPSD